MQQAEAAIDPDGGAPVFAAGGLSSRQELFGFVPAFFALADTGLLDKSFRLKFNVVLIASKHQGLVEFGEGFRPATGLTLNVALEHKLTALQRFRDRRSQKLGRLFAPATIEQDFGFEQPPLRCPGIVGRLVLS
ncbi:MAG: hypothetical protein KF797_10535 [Flavobacteriales bacterium]|nr:hypothetical protein [Flavobacteriales bacterium]